MYIPRSSKRLVVSMLYETMFLKHTVDTLLPMQRDVQLLQGYHGLDE